MKAFKRGAYYISKLTSNKVLAYQREHTEHKTIQYAMQQVAFENILSSEETGMYSSIWTFADESRLYLEQDVFYEVPNEK